MITFIQSHLVLFMVYALVNVVCFLLFAIDKGKAIRNKWRIPEATLLTVSFLGGALGGLLAMLLCRHKIRKPRFFIGVPAMLILHLLLFWWFFVR